MMSKLKKKDSQTIHNFSPSAADARALWGKYLKKPLLYSREEAFSELIQNVSTGLQKLCKTKSRVLLLNASGTGALECAIASLPPDKTVVVIRNGYFGQRLYEIASFHIQNVVAFDLPFGQPFSKMHETALKTSAKEANANVLICVHLETSSSVLNDAALLSRIGETLNAITIVDGVSSLGSIECNLGEWGADCFVSSAYKALLCPAGLSFMIANEDFLAAADRKWSYSYDIEKLTTASQENRFLWSPNVVSLECLNDVIDSILAEGQERYFKKATERAGYFRNQLAQDGLEIFGDADYLSPCFTTIKLPQENAWKWLALLKKDHGIVIGKGMGESAEKYIRIGHYPNKGAQEFEQLATALSDVSKKITKYES